MTVGDISILQKFFEINFSLVQNYYYLFEQLSYALVCRASSDDFIYKAQEALPPQKILYKCSFCTVLHFLLVISILSNGKIVYPILPHEILYCFQKVKEH